MFLSLRREAAKFADVFGFAPIEEAVVHARHEAFTANGMIVSDNFFSGLGARPFIGQLFAPGDENGSAAQNVVITHEWWERRFANDPGVLGQTVTINGTEFMIIGVLPRSFPGVQPNDPRAFYTAMTPQSPFRADPFGSDFHWWVRLMARLKPNVSEAQLKASLDVVFPREASEQMNAPEILVRPGRSGLAFGRNEYGKPLLLMLAVVGLVMLVVSANLAGLSLARGAARQHELAVRAALGAMRLRLMRLALTENLLLALVGGGLGIVLATWGKTVIARLLAGSTDGLHYDLRLDRIVLGFSLSLVLLTALLSGLLPALRAARVDPLSGLKERAAAGRQRLRTGRILVAVQICLSLCLLFGAGLYVRTFINLTNINAGFDTEGLLLFELNPGAAGYRDNRLISFYEQVQSSIAGMPGISGVTHAQYHLFDNHSSRGGFRLSGVPEQSANEMETYRVLVSETFFPTLGIPVLQGRSLSAADIHAVVVNETFVRKYSPDRSPIGQTMRIWRAEWNIVGVCADTKYKNIKEATPPVTYFSYRGRIPGEGCFTVRSELPPLALANTVRRAVAQIDPDVPVAHIRTQNQVRKGNISQERFLVTLCMALAGLALLLSCIGLYGLMAYHVTRRTNEIAIRVAIGAQRGDIAGPILREAFLLAALGIAAGLPVILIAARLIKSQLYDVQPHDPVTLGAAMATLAAVALLAAWLPARRATKVDPMEALRCE
jgi:predicted permease